MTGRADRSADSGSGSTPRNGAESIGTVTAASPRPASCWVIRPPKEWPMTAGWCCRAEMTSAMWLVTLQEVGLTRVVNPWCRRPDVTVLLPVIGGLPDVSPCASQSSRYKRKSIREAGLMIGGSDDVVKALVNPVALA